MVIIMEAVKTMAALIVMDAEKGGWDLTAITSDQPVTYEMCMVGRFLT